MPSLGSRAIPRINIRHTHQTHSTPKAQHRPRHPPNPAQVKLTRHLNGRAAAGGHISHGLECPSVSHRRSPGRGHSQHQWDLLLDDGADARKCPGDVPDGTRACTVGMSSCGRPIDGKRRRMIDRLQSVPSASQQTRFKTAPVGSVVAHGYRLYGELQFV